MASLLAGIDLIDAKELAEGFEDPIQEAFVVNLVSQAHVAAMMPFLIGWR